MAHEKGTFRSERLFRTIVVASGMLVVIVVLMLVLTGTFHEKIDSGKRPDVRARSAKDATVVAVEKLSVPVTESAVGSVRPVHETSVASKILAKVEAVHASAGQPVAKGDLLIELDDANLQARLEQAQAAERSARAARDQALVEAERVRDLYAGSAASKLELDRVETALKSAQAELEKAEQVSSEARTVLNYARIHSPLDGIVVEKLVDVGDTVTPGQALMNLYNPDRMQLIASVRESLTRRLEVGQNIEVRIEVLDHPCEGLISEIVPEAESASRTFSVKVTGPCPPGVYGGMFGRIIIPLDEEEILVVPKAAVRTVGQLTMLDVVEGEVLKRRAVSLGREYGEKVEVLSGLRPDERVALTVEQNV